MFCCIAIVVFAIGYWLFLSFRQLLINLPKDKTSCLPVPPRALTGNRAQPVFGHTRLFRRLGGDSALRFRPTWREWNFLPKWCSRQLGNCFAIFIWGQWRVAIIGPERVKRVMESEGKLKDDWPWSPPIALLGSKCIPLMENDAAEFLYQMLAKPLSHEAIIDFAPMFADLAEKFMDDLSVGTFQSDREKRRRSCRDHEDSIEKIGLRGSGSSLSDNCDLDQLEPMEEGLSGPDQGVRNIHRISYEALRSFTFDLIDGPVLRMNRWCHCKDQKANRSFLSQRKHGHVQSNQRTNDKVGRENMLVWMDRLKRAMCVIKMTFGAEWMYVWALNAYGRAVNGREHIYQVINKHIEKCSKAIPVPRKTGHTFKDPFSVNFPIVAMAENLLYANETATGRPAPKRALRQRTLSEPILEYSPHSFYTCTTEDVIPDHDQNDSCQDLLNPHSMSVVTGKPHSPPLRSRASTCPDVIITPSTSPWGHNSRNTTPLLSDMFDDEEAEKRSILDGLLRRHDALGDGLTAAALTESSILLWMILDAGNAWTAMALNLLALDESACSRVQQELDELSSLHGKDKLFTNKVMSEMYVLDGLLYEAIRLCPPFLGGLKRTTKMIELTEDGLQIPKNTSLFFCQATGEGFDLSKGMAKRPQDLGKHYPSPALYGFLPFKGLEVPLMVLQSKVLLAVLLQRFTPFLSSKTTFIRILKTAVFKSRRIIDGDGHEEISSITTEAANSIPSHPSERRPRHGDVSQKEAMDLFDKIPFPEPRREMHLVERHSPLDVPTPVGGVRCSRG